MTMQYKDGKELEGTVFRIIKDLLNWVWQKFQSRAIHAFANSDLEHKIFGYLGYANVDEQVILALPV